MMLALSCNRCKVNAKQSEEYPTAVNYSDLHDVVGEKLALGESFSYRVRPSHYLEVFDQDEWSKWLNKVWMEDIRT